jgi:Spy/CpxP family protein refolding chaperone
VETIHQLLQKEHEMNISRKTMVTFLAVSSLALGIGVASAGGKNRDGWGNWGNCHGQENTADSKKRLEAWHERLHEALKLSPEQESAWKTFSEQARPANIQRPDPGEFAKLTAPERLEKHLELSRQHQEIMSQRLAALKTFYAALAPEQQKIFDDFHSPKNPQDRERKKDKRR